MITRCFIDEIAYVDHRSALNLLQTSSPSLVFYDREVTVGYYDPYPQVRLAKPICLVGFMGSETHSVGYFVSSMTGLPYVELDKLIEHEVGMSLAQLYLEDGERRWRRLEALHLSRVLKQTPPRLICLGDGSLLNRESQKLCLSSAKLVYIRRPRTALLSNIQRGRVETPGRYPYWSQRIPRSIEDLDALLRTREPTYELAHTLIDAGELTSLEVARRLMTRYGWLSEEF